MSKMREGEGVMKYEIRLKETETERIYDKGGILVLIPQSYEAACLYGRKTKWCISAVDTKMHWASHLAKNVAFYIVINRNLDEKDLLYKVLVEVWPDGKILYWDVRDNAIPKPDFID
ncbi:MAG: hypothetical protein V1709_08615 [Planctomycetota bacterium]